MVARIPVVQRFMNKVSKQENGCWLWRSAVGTSGYGSFFFCGRNTRAHRVAYQLFKGEICAIEGADSRGTCVIHTCDNPRCVNPEHLRLGTHQDNMTDKKVRNRVVSHPLLGEKHQNSKLKADDIIDIRCLKYVGATPPQIAEIFNVNRSTIHRVLDGTTWNHI